MKEGQRESTERRNEGRRYGKNEGRKEGKNEGEKAGWRKE